MAVSKTQDAHHRPAWQLHHLFFMFILSRRGVLSLSTMEAPTPCWRVLLLILLLAKVKPVDGWPPLPTPSPYSLYSRHTGGALLGVDSLFSIFGTSNNNNNKAKERKKRMKEAAAGNFGERKWNQNPSLSRNKATAAHIIASFKFKWRAETLLFAVAASSSSSFIIIIIILTCCLLLLVYFLLDFSQQHCSSVVLAANCYRPKMTWRKETNTTMDVDYCASLFSSDLCVLDSSSSAATNCISIQDVAGNKVDNLTESFMSASY